MRIDEEAEYREGIVLDRPTKPGKGSLVNCGMRKVSSCGLEVESFALKKGILGSDERI